MNRNGKKPEISKIIHYVHVDFNPLILFIMIFQNNAWQIEKANILSLKRKKNTIGEKPTMLWVYLPIEDYLLMISTKYKNVSDRTFIKFFKVSDVLLRCGMGWILIFVLWYFHVLLVDIVLGGAGYN